MHQVTANYTMPTILSTLRPAASGTLAMPPSARGYATNAAGTSNSNSSSTSGANLGTTFLSLLAQELQNQDPTAPVDPTAMVGQMISLNQLEQLIGINQTLDQVSSSAPTATSGATRGSGAVQPAVAGSSAALTAANGGIASLLSPSAAAAATTQLPFDPNTMMPLTSANASAVAASLNSAISAANMRLSGSTNNTSGGK
jgi:flagellar basal-body rod modification protein FlgD